jgi:hypothetical protein
VLAAGGRGALARNLVQASTMEHRIGAGLLVLGLVAATPVVGRAGNVVMGPERIVSADRMQDMVAVRDVTTRDGVVSGVVENRSGTLRGVELRIHHDFLWNDEFRPGAESPSRIDYHQLPQDIPPGGTARFRFEAPPLPRRTDGRFVTSVDVAKAVEITQPGISAR